jgi:branched-chain amino acid transport system substrate-binding protein
MRHPIYLTMMCLSALFALSSCDKPYTPPEPPPRTLSTYQPPAAPAPLVAKPGQITTAPLRPQNRDGFVEGKTVRIGLLLPLTGRSAELGRALQDAATVSLFDKYATLSTKQATIQVELLPKDTGDTPEQAAQAMNEALAEGVEFVIGPVFADATEAVAPMARARNVGVLSFSNSTAVGGSGIYMFGFSPQEQTARVIHYAVDAGKTRIAALVPDSPLGTTVLEAAKTALATRGIVLVKEVRYSAQGVGVDTAANELLSPTGTPAFDALLLPEGGPPLGTILRALNARGVNGSTVQLLGTGMWDDSALVRRVPLEGAWLASSSPLTTASFENRFRSTYEYTPPRIASLAYDAVALAVTLATSGRPFDVPTLTSHAGFAGPANGVFRIRPDGRVERGLAVMQVQAGTFRVLSPAPGGFQQ